MRIVGGRLRGLGLAPVGKGDAERHLRPTADRVRESLFNLLAHGNSGDPVRGAQVLDLFAGTGALGLEALSRGASFVTFIDNGRVARKLIAANILRAKAEAETRVLHRDATRPGPADSPPATLVFLDPPYGRNLGEKALSAALSGGWIAPAALVVWEERGEQPAPEGFRLRDARRYGETCLTFLQPLSPR